MAGFKHSFALDIGRDACETLRQNQKLLVLEKDVKDFDFSSIGSEPALLAGGPPCQPFSNAGKHLAKGDPRDCFPHALRAVKALRPKSFVFENVSGMLRRSWVEQVTYLIRQLQEPEIPMYRSENWFDHSARLYRSSLGASVTGRLRYRVQLVKLNAADFGVPQSRNRVIFVGFRDDLNARWSAPLPTHSIESLLVSKWITFEYWGEHGIDPPVVGSRLEIIKAKRALGNPELLIRQRWATVRDAIGTLPDPEKPVGEKNRIRAHEYIPGARAYVGHSGSILDFPSKTIKSGVNGIGGGENMLCKDDQSVRYFTNLEMLRLQTFPDNYKISGTRSSVVKQIGNSVPPLLAKLIGLTIRQSLKRA